MSAFIISSFSFIFPEYENSPFRLHPVTCHYSIGSATILRIWRVYRQQFDRLNTRRHPRGRANGICTNVRGNSLRDFIIFPVFRIFSWTFFFAFPTFRTSSPKKDIYYPSEPIEAECRVTGMPVPTVEWVHGTGSMNVSCPLKINFHAENSVNINRKIFFSQNNDFELNTIMEHSPSGIATVVARLIIKPHHVKPGTTKTFTCVGKSGAKIVKASSEFYLIKILIFLILELIPKFFREYFFIFLAF